MSAGYGDDTLIDNDASADVLHGGDDNDTFIIFNSEIGDQYDGGSGIDTLDFSNSGQSRTIYLETYYSNTGVSFVGFENAVGGWEYDTIYGGAGANTIDGGQGIDFVEARGGADTLIDSDSSADSLYGEDGDDTFVISKAVAGDIYDGGADNDLLDLSGATGLNFDIANPLDLTGAGAIAFHNFERIIATSGADRIIGAGIGEDISGGAGIDTIFGNDGDDILEGGLGGDLLDGGTGNNTAAYRNAAAAVDGVTGVTAALLTPQDNTGEAVGDVCQHRQPDRFGLQRHADRRQWRQPADRRRRQRHP